MYDSSSYEGDPTPEQIRVQAAIERIREQVSLHEFGRVLLYIAKIVQEGASDRDVRRFTESLAGLLEDITDDFPEGDAERVWQEVFDKAGEISGELSGLDGHLPDLHNFMRAFLERFA